MGWVTAVTVVIVAYLCSTFDDLTEFAELRQAKTFWTNLTSIVNRSAAFQSRYDLLTSLPTGEESWRNYRRVEVELLKWHNEMYAIQASLSNDIDTAHTKLLMNALARENIDWNDRRLNSRERKYKKYKADKDDMEEHGDRARKKRRKTYSHNDKSYVKYGDAGDKDRDSRPRSWSEPVTTPDGPKVSGAVAEIASLSSGTLKWLTHILTVYTMICLITSVSQNQGLIILTLILTLILMPLVFKGKAVNDHLTDALLNLRLRQVQLAGVFPSSSKAEMIAQHLILQKIDVIADYWEHQTLGLKFKIPFIEYEISLENEVLGGMIIANILKLLEIYVFAGNEGKPNVDPTKLG